MDTLELGKTIKEIRKARKYTQKELADGICTQAYISKLESGFIIPSADFLYRISIRMGISMNDFFLNKDSIRRDYFNDIDLFVRQKLKESDFKAILDLIEKEVKNPLLTSKADKQFFMWHKGVCIFYLHNDLEKALQLLTDGLYYIYEKETQFTQREVEILVSIGNIYNDSKDYLQAEESYKKAIRIIKELSMKTVKTTIYIRVLYNYSKLLYRRSEYTLSLKYVNEAILKCISIDSLYLLGDLKYQKGLILLQLNQYQRSREAMLEASYLFKVQNNYKYFEHVQNQITKNMDLKLFKNDKDLG
ncbi:transcriptional regulator with XRE-family HTH domain [Peribacillus deserti]|uniref:Transcriptional regulator with XRE-family HTH domain n=1 Tax=Peribacillus deserti TaxID=673318 RepID=A0ABS2QDI3_9BACI|nr:helix-turn-helix domain-containing protein [Peribacillus deserti]MBM7690739.1 transcriptional regulator with XRE-family HTH domain [Peribacillus deserti]